MVNVRAARSRDALVAAMMTMLEGGLDRVPGITEVCETAGVSRPTFYLHFGDVGTLAGAAVEQRLSTALASVVPRPQERSAAASSVVRAVLERILDDKVFYRGVLNGPVALAVHGRITAYVAERLLTVSPFAVKLRAADADWVMFVAAGTTQLLTQHLLEADTSESVEATASRVADTLAIAAAALSAASAGVPEGSAAYFAVCPSMAPASPAPVSTSASLDAGHGGLD
jgi:AcrR family transcriptional regulator